MNQAESHLWAERGEYAQRLAEALPSYLVKQRWYPAKDAGPPVVSLAFAEPIAIDGGDAALTVWSATPPGESPIKLCVPIAILPSAAAAQLGPFKIGTLPAGRQLIDAAASEEFIRQLVARIGYALPAHDRVKRMEAEQSNTSIRLGEAAILKLFRKLSTGVNTELEMTRFLAPRLEQNVVPALLGSMNADDSTVAVLQSFVPNEGDGWAWVQRHLTQESRRANELPPWIHTLARRTAELHVALAAPSEDPDFSREIATASDWTTWVSGITTMLDRAVDSLHRARKHRELGASDLAIQFERSAPALKEQLHTWIPQQDTYKSRLHGDYHLGQILIHRGDVSIVDFEGEPLRPLAERRAKHIPLKDVAGMVRSFDYAVAVAALQKTGRGSVAIETAGVPRRWAERASAEFTAAYLSALKQMGLPLDPEDSLRMLRLFCVEKALYEVLYELSNRPAWVAIPLRALLAMTAERIEWLPLRAATTARWHKLPQGAEVLEQGGIRFRAWAPGCENLEVALYEGRTQEVFNKIPMTALADGWFEAQVTQANTGARYHYVLPDGTRVPDAASRFQPDDVHGPSEVIDPKSYAWRDAQWTGRPWHEAVLYELHIGTFTPEGTFRSAMERLPHLVNLGVTALQIMPIADFPGKRNWGYDGVLPYAPDSVYGRPEDFKALIDSAHALGLMVMLDVVYNHFGPEGNFLPAYAPAFFTARHRTPWGDAVNYDGAGSAPVREFMVHNALYWLVEYHLDGLRLDAVHAIKDDGDKHFLDELAERARAVRPQVHLVLENEENQARRLQRSSAGLRHYTAQWNDDVHHVLHVAATGESQGYYADYLGKTQLLARALAEGFAYQGEMMNFRGSPRGEPSTMLPPSAFVAFIQNHDQIGNRAFGERLTALAAPEAVRAVAAIYLLLPQIPMLFMGEEWGASQPFPFFCDFSGELADAVRQGRRREFAKFPEFQNEDSRSLIPDPQAVSTFASAKLDWDAVTREAHAQWLALYKRLLALRRERVIPIIPALRDSRAVGEVLAPGVVLVRWEGAGEVLQLVANLSDKRADVTAPSRGSVLWEEGMASSKGLSRWYVRWSVDKSKAPTV